MAQQLGQSVIGILNSQGIIVGTGFVVSDQLAVTCAHVVKAASSDCGQAVRIKFFTSESEQTAQVLTKGWSAPEVDDTAFLLLESLPEGAVSVVLGTAEGRSGHQYSALGFARVANYESRFAYDNLGGIVPVPDKHKRPMLQLIGDEIKGGMSGAPVLDTSTNRVVGMVSEYKDDERTRFAWATTADTLAALNSLLRIWSDAYGPKELNAYLDYLIDNNQTLTLPDGRQVSLERIYASLRADEINTIERKAEHDLYLEDVAALKKLVKGTVPDQYTEFAAMRKAIARHPKMVMLDARNWTRLFGERKHDLLSLSEVVRQHPQVVLLGDPGSGKTTLGRWLVLQFAYALRQDKSHVQIRADLVRPSAEANNLIDLGPARLPILIRIADYARLRWDKEQGDTKLPLERFLGFWLKSRNLPFELSPEAVDALIQDYLAQGRALLILDGLDEVGNPDQRREVMQTVKKLIYGQTFMPKVTAITDNRVILTSRIVGYQFQPLTDLPHYTVEDMDETAIVAFCRAWMMHVAEAEEVIEQAEKLKDAIFDHAHPGVRSLAGNPLLLTILAQVYWSNTERSLPTRRVALFDAATKAMYDQRKEFWNRVNIPSLRLTRALGVVAMHIHANEKTGFAEEGTVREQLGTVLFDREQVEAVLEAAREVSGFLVARGEGVYGFLHRSVQEYFAAQYLVDLPASAAINLARRSLDASWREPIILAVGVVSQRRYPNSRRHLTEVFDALLNVKDLAGDFLPRRELLAVDACVECERIPPETGIVRRIAENLVTMYARHGGHGKSMVLSARIHRAFKVLHDSEARDQTETALREALEASDLERRYAAVNVIIETTWDSPSLASTLVKAWLSFADPAVLLLTALDEMTKRHPDYFQLDFLPLRQAVTVNSLLWERATANQEWKAIISVLYLPPNARFRSEQINRDSPLTPQLLATLRQELSPDALVSLRQYLVPLASQPGTAIARDAALVLSILDDRDWIAASVANADSEGSDICSIVTALAGSLDRVFDLDRISDLTHILVCAHTLDLTLASALEYANDPDLDIPDLESIPVHARARIVAIDRALGLSLYHANGLAKDSSSREYHSSRIDSMLKAALASAYDLDLALELSHDLALVHTNALDLRNARFEAFSLARASNRARRTHNRDHARDLEQESSRAFAFARSLAFILADDISTIRNHVREATNSFAHVRTRAHTLTEALSQTRARVHVLTEALELVVAHVHTRSRYSNRTHLGNCNQACNLEFVLAPDLEFVLALTNTESHICEVKRYIQNVQAMWGADNHQQKILNSALTYLHTIQKIIATSTHIAQSLSTLIVACRNRWLMRAKLPADLVEPDAITTDALMILVTNLTSSNDAKRYHAQRVLEAKRLASALGQSVIEQIGQLTIHVDNPLVRTQLTWTLQEIIHDTPVWITQWIEQASIATQNNTPAEVILGSIHRIMPETLETILNALPDLSPRVNITLLKSLSWLARLKRIPKGRLPTARKQLLAWLDQETDPNTRCAIIEVLGYWQEDSDTVGNALLNQLNPPMLDSDRRALYKALALLATCRPNLTTPVRSLLHSVYPEPTAAAGLIRMSLMENKQNSVKLHTVLARSDNSHYLTALLIAGTDDDVWQDEYHGILANAIRAHLEIHADLLPILVARLQQAISQQNWPLCRIALAAVAACTEVMPIAVQRAYPGSLEGLLVKATIDAESFNSRRFALTILSYLRTVTQVIAPALLAGCQDTELVQRDSIAAASRFQSIEGNPLPLLIGKLTGESVSTAYAVAQLLGALDVSGADEAIDLREQIIEALVNALKDPNSQREVVISGENEGKLEDTLYTSLLRVAGWIG